MVKMLTKIYNIITGNSEANLESLTREQIKKYGDTKILFSDKIDDKLLLKEYNRETVRNIYRERGLRLSKSSFSHDVEQAYKYFDKANITLEEQKEFYADLVPSFTENAQQTSRVRDLRETVDVAKISEKDTPTLYTILTNSMLRIIKQNHTSYKFSKCDYRYMLDLLQKSDIEPAKKEKITKSSVETLLKTHDRKGIEYAVEIADKSTDSKYVRHTRWKAAELLLKISDNRNTVQQAKEYYTSIGYSADDIDTNVLQHVKVDYNLGGKISGIKVQNPVGWYFLANNIDIFNKKKSETWGYPPQLDTHLHIYVLEKAGFYNGNLDNLQQLANLYLKTNQKEKMHKLASRISAIKDEREKQSREHN